MRQLMLIVGNEWRYWLSSYLALAAVGLFTILLLLTSLLTAVRMESERHTRAHHQNEAEETFLAQPDRHPHRMVHYGHYIFREPAPLAVFDSGLDTLTGQSIFLEGHRQNSAMFAESGASADLGGLSLLTPALMYQLFAPLLIILLGHSALVREREAGVLVPLLAQGISNRTLILGKVLALLFFSVLLLIPLFINGLVAVFNGESYLPVLLLVFTYLSYLSVWTVLTLFVSVILRERSTVLAMLCATWFATTLVLPSIAVNVSVRNTPLAGKIETDLTMLKELRKLGDGHNANDPAFSKLRADFLKKHEVEKIEDLPINYRGIVAADAEQKLTDVLNHHADKRMEAETRQAKSVFNHGWLSPTIAIASASRAISGTDLEHYHRFMREAEKIRYEFVQGLNRAHVEKLSYQDDINRNKNEESSLRARVSADNWQVLSAYRFKPAKFSERLGNSKYSLIMLIAWLSISCIALMSFSGRLKL